MSPPTASGDCLAERRKELRRAPAVFGLDFIEVCSGKDCQSRKFWLHFLGRRPRWLRAEHIQLKQVESGVTIPVTFDPDEARPDDTHRTKVHLNVADVSDHVDYELTVTAPEGAPSTLDPYFNFLVFRFEPHQQAEVDCLPSPRAVPAATPPPEINYLAKDYATFRQLLLDRLAVTLPDWQEKCPADLGVMLVEILAYSADHLSYYQDAVATEAYLGTARLRQSLRRHARLVDYRVHEGCNARVWVHLRVSSNTTIENAQDLFFASLSRSSVALRTNPLTSAGLGDLLRNSQGCEVFEPVVSKTLKLWFSHNECQLYDWRGATPCLEQGATWAWLVDRAPDGAAAGERLHFKVGDVVLLEELLSPWTGCAKDADRNHRHFVRITSVCRERDHLFNVALLKITWDEADALPFTLWLTKPAAAEWDCNDGPNVAIVRGNIVLADHGRRVLTADVNLAESHAAPPKQFEPHYPPARIRATLASRNLTFSDSLPRSGAPAAAQLQQDPRRATPQLILQAKDRHQQIVGSFSILELRDYRRMAKRLLTRANIGGRGIVSPPMKRSHALALRAQHACGCHPADGEPNPVIDFDGLRNTIRNELRDVWMPHYDLLDSSSADNHFVVEMSDDRQASLRFGQDGFGRTPDLNNDPALAEMLADYRIGNGTKGNVPAEAIQAFGSYGQPIPAIESVRNPRPAVGGADPESPREVRLFAPHAIRSQLRRAITAQDYERIVMREFSDEVQRARATLLWTGHEWRVLVAVDPKGREEPPRTLLEQIRRELHRCRRISHSVRVCAATRVVPVIELSVCLSPHTIRGQVANQLNRLFSDQILPDGSPAFFHPDQSTFGEGIFVSQIVSSAARVAGVIHVEVKALHRSHEGPAREVEDGVLRLRPGEIVRFDNIRRRRQFGVLKLDIKGGR